MQPYIGSSYVLGVGDYMPPYTLENGISVSQTIIDVELI